MVDGFGNIAGKTALDRLEKSISDSTLTVSELQRRKEELRKPSS
jgi:hypothetical protein